VQVEDRVKVVVTCCALTAAIVVGSGARPAAAQTPSNVSAAVSPPRPDAPAAPDDQTQEASRADLIEQAQSQKAAALAPAKRGKAEEYITRAGNAFLGGQIRWHSFFHSAYSGGGFTLGAGYTKFVSPNNTLDTRGSITFTGYKRIETEFIAPGLFDRRATLNVIGGWREATQVGFYGFGMTSTVDARANYSFQQPYGSAMLELRPTRKVFVMRGGLELTQWKQAEGSGSEPSIETKYAPETLPGLGAKPVYVHAAAGIGIDSRTAAGYARQGGLYAVTFHDFTDTDRVNGFQELDYEIVQHIPVLREAWVISLHGLLQTAYSKHEQQIPFFMMPSIGGGSDLRAYASWRLRDLNSLLLQAEWRVLANRYLDMAVFYDAGRVGPYVKSLKFDELKNDVGIGFRFHGPAATPLRIELAKGNEGFGLVFAASQAF
jgi:hypothetical protein